MSKKVAILTQSFPVRRGSLIATYSTTGEDIPFIKLRMIAIRLDASSSVPDLYLFKDHAVCLKTGQTHAASSFPAKVTELWKTVKSYVKAGANVVEGTPDYDYFDRLASCTRAWIDEGSPKEELTNSRSVPGIDAVSHAAYEAIRQLACFFQVGDKSSVEFRELFKGQLVNHVVFALAQMVLSKPKQSVRTIGSGDSLSVIWPITGSAYQIVFKKQPTLSKFWLYVGTGSKLVLFADEELLSLLYSYAHSPDVPDVLPALLDKLSRVLPT